MLAGAVLGSAAGYAGSHLSGHWPLFFVLGAVLVILLGPLAERLTKRSMKPQLDREAPFGWVNDNAYRWAWRTGLMLGSGVMTRVAFWSFYVVPVVAVASGQAFVGALVWGCYGAARGVLGISPLPRVASDDDAATLRRRRQVAGRLDPAVAALGGAGISLLMVVDVLQSS